MRITMRMTKEGGWDGNGADGNDDGSERGKR